MSDQDSVLGVIVAGFAHGGTTVLLDTLRGHPELDSGFECHLLLSPSPSEFAKLAEEPGRLARGWHLSEQGLAAVVNSPDFDEAYRQLRLVSPRIRKPKAKLIDKTPHYLRDLPTVMERAPDTPVVVVLRDPRALYWSWLKRRRTEPTELQRVSLSRHVIHQYRQGIRALEQAVARYPKRIFVLNHERFAHEPEPLVRDLCRFLKLDFVPEMMKLENHHRNTHGGSISPKYLWEFREHVPRPLWRSISKQIPPHPFWEPYFSVVTPVASPKLDHFRQCVRSVQAQSYPLWEHILVLDREPDLEMAKFLGEIEGMRGIRVLRFQGARGVAGATNRAMEEAIGDYICFLDHDDWIEKDALREFARVAREKGADLIYSDENVLDEASGSIHPFLKPSYSPDYLLHSNYFCHFVAVHQNLAERVGPLNPDFDSAQDHDFVLRAEEKAKEIVHVPKVLYTWRRHSDAFTGNTRGMERAITVCRQLVDQALERRGIQGTVEEGYVPGTLRVRRAILGRPSVSVLIPFRDRPELLSACVRSMQLRTTYPNWDLLLIDNGSELPETRACLEEIRRNLGDRVRTLRLDIPFNYGLLNNLGAAQAEGEHLCLLNNDIEVIAPDWMECLLEHSQRPEVGAVGARLTYPDRTIQHAGIVIGFGGVAGHQFHGLSHTLSGYGNKVLSTLNLSAVTGACLMIRKKLFFEVGGFNSTELRDDFTDVDLCLRLREKGKWIVYTPYAHLLHRGSASRQANREEAMKVYQRYIRDRHRGIYMEGDPFYNPNFSLEFDHIPRQVSEQRRGRLTRDARLV